MIYLVFTEGYAAASDDDLAAEAIRLGRLLVELMPDSDEACGLLALMLLQHARRAARVVDGELVTLEDQDRSRWDTDAITEALALGAGPGSGAGPTASRPTSPPSTPPPSTPLRRTGCASSPSTTSCWRSIRRPSSPSTGRSPSGMSDGPLAGLRALDAVGRRLPDFHLVAGRPRRAARPGGTYRRGPSGVRPSDRARAVRARNDASSPAAAPELDHP